MKKGIICSLLFFALILNGSRPDRGTLAGTPREGGPVSTPQPGQNHQMVVLSTGTVRTRQIGMDILSRGGTAVDAALACALARIVEDMGRIVSFAGIFGMVYYEASSGKTYSLNACFKTPWRKPIHLPYRPVAYRIPGPCSYQDSWPVSRPPTTGSAGFLGVMSSLRPSIWPRTDSLWTPGRSG